jgi:16S rRNA (adenine1518-N6/adenine1519-N6)-dimethyltransferase
MSAHRARKRFGQHFLIDSAVIDAIVHAVAPGARDTVVEIGPGQGAITAPLLARAGHMHIIELDRDLARVLRERYATEPKLTIHEADALRFDFATLGNGLRIVGNLPYNISTPLLFHLLEYREHVTDMHFMLQKEVVDRMAAGPGSRAYGRLGIMLGCFFRIDSLFTVDRLAFSPPPEVMSAIVRLVPLPAGTYEIRDAARLSQLLATAFSQRRKTVRNALRQVADEAMLESVGIDPALRPEAIAIAEYVRLANTLE